MDLSQIDMLGKCELRTPEAMTAVRGDNVGSGWRKLFALLLVVLAIGPPINNISDYVLRVILTVVIFSGEVRRES